MTLLILKFVCRMFGHSWPEDSSEHCKCCGAHWCDGSEDFSIAAHFASFVYRTRRSIKAALWALRISKTCPHCQAHRDGHGAHCTFEAPF